MESSTEAKPGHDAMDERNQEARAIRSRWLAWERLLVERSRAQPPSFLPRSPEWKVCPQRKTGPVDRTRAFRSASAIRIQALVQPSGPSASSLPPSDAPI